MAKGHNATLFCSDVSDAPCSVSCPLRQEPLLEASTHQEVWAHVVPGQQRLALLHKGAVEPGWQRVDVDSPALAGSGVHVCDGVGGDSLSCGRLQGGRRERRGAHPRILTQNGYARGSFSLLPEGRGQGGGKDEGKWTSHNLGLCAGHERRSAGSARSALELPHLLRHALLRSPRPWSGSQW